MSDGAELGVDVWYDWRVWLRHRETQTGVDEMQKTYENGATVKLICLNPSEPCVTLRHVVFNVYDKNGAFAVQLDDQFDAVELAKSL